MPAENKPQYGGNQFNNRPQQQQQSEPECKTEYQTISEIVYEEFNEQVCQDTTRHSDQNNIFKNCRTP